MKGGAPKFPVKARGKEEVKIKAMIINGQRQHLVTGQVKPYSISIYTMM